MPRLPSRVLPAGCAALPLPHAPDAAATRPRHSPTDPHPDGASLVHHRPDALPGVRH